MPDTAQREPDPVGETLGALVLTVAHLIRWAWRMRLELGLLTMIAATWLLVADEPLLVQISGVGFLAVLLGAAWPLLGPALATRRVRRAWIDATDGRYRIRRAKIVPAGERLTVQIPRGDTVENLARLAPQLRDTLRVQDVRVTRGDGGQADVLIYRRDPFDRADPIPWPDRDTDTTDVWQPMPFAVDEAGQELTVESMGGHVLIAGVTNSGKSVALHLFMATIALDPRASAYLFDGKMVELSPWTPCSRHYVQTDMAEAVVALRAIQLLMRSRFADLAAQGRRHIGPDDETHHVVIDELAWYLRGGGTRKQRADFLATLLDILQNGRAAGFRVVATMQRPSATSLDTDARAQFAYRICFRTADRETGHMVLGNTDGVDPYDIPEKGFEGVGFVGGDRKARRVRSYLLTDTEIADIAARASSNRIDADLLTLTAPEPDLPILPPQMRTENRKTPTPPASPAGAGDSRTRSVWEALPDDADQAVSYTDLERMLGGRHRWRGDLQRLCDSGAVQVRRGNSHGGPKLFWRTRDPEVAEPSP